MLSPWSVSKEAVTVLKPDTVLILDYILNNLCSFNKYCYRLTHKKSYFSVGFIWSQCFARLEAYTLKLHPWDEFQLKTLSTSDVRPLSIH